MLTGQKSKYCFYLISLFLDSMIIMIEMISLSFIVQ